MEEKKSNKWLICLIVILIILVLGLVGFIVYDKVLKVYNTIPNEEIITTSSTNTTNIKNEQSKSKVSEIFNDYPIKNDETVIVKGFFEELIDNSINHTEIYENKKNKFIGTDIEFIYNSKKCDIEEYENDTIINSYNWCEDIEISIENNYVFTITEYSKGTSYTSPYILITDNYIIVQYDRYLGDGKGYIKIFNLNGNLIKEINNTGYHGGLPIPDDVNNYSDYSFKDKYVILNNDRLYYVSHSNICFSEDNTNNASINYLDLNTMKENVLKEFKAYFSQQC